MTRIPPDKLEEYEDDNDILPRGVTGPSDKEQIKWPPKWPHDETVPPLDWDHNMYAALGAYKSNASNENHSDDPRSWWESKKRRPQAPLCDPRATGSDEKCGGWIGPNYTPRSDEEIQADQQPRDRYELDEILRLMTPEERRRYEWWVDSQDGRPPDPENSNSVQFNKLLDPARRRWLEQHKGYRGY